MTFPGPIPPYSNPPIQPQNYKPSQFFISDVTLGMNTTIQATVNMNYVIGQKVRLIIPNGFGCVQLNNREAYVIEIPQPNQVLLRLDSSQNTNEFVLRDLINQPQIVAIGDINSGVISSTGLYNPTTTIPGAFINIS